MGEHTFHICEAPGSIPGTHKHNRVWLCHYLEFSTTRKPRTTGKKRQICDAAGNGELRGMDVGGFF